MGIWVDLGHSFETQNSPAPPHFYCSLFYTATHCSVESAYGGRRGTLRGTDVGGDVAIGGVLAGTAGKSAVVRTESEISMPFENFSDQSTEIVNRSNPLNLIEPNLPIPRPIRDQSKEEGTRTLTHIFRPRLAGIPEP